MLFKQLEQKESCFLTGTGAEAEQPESPSKKNLIKAKEDVGKLKEENKNLRE